MSDFNNDDSILICLTASFPYGSKETFFENELPYLSSSFGKVLIFPVYDPNGENLRRQVPDNVVVYNPLVSNNKPLRLFKGIFNVSPFTKYFQDFFTKRVYKSRVNFQKWINSLVVFRTAYGVLKEELPKAIENQKKIVYYSYWAEAPIFTTNLCSKGTKVVRMHRGDFYLEFNHGYLPLRKWIYNAADILVPISKDIISILTKDYGINDEKIFLNYLGVNNDHQPNLNQNTEDVIRIVSCSRVDPVKRVHLISKMLSGYFGEKIIEWHHFGDGKEFEELKESIATISNSAVRIILHGWATQEDIYSFYRMNYVTWFINVSLSEGIPVSIMEAMSYGIPVIATDVGGTNEIVNANNGFLISVNFDVEKILEMILSVNNHDTYNDKRVNAYEIWSNQYNAEKNYKNLVEVLKMNI